MKSKNGRGGSKEQILEYLEKGVSLKEISAQMGVSYHTVSMHVRELLKGGYIERNSLYRVVKKWT